jgi:hypothetical protein
MESRGEVELSAPVGLVFDYFATPRNLVMANNRGAVTDHSDPSDGPGSWAVLKFDQIRLRIEYPVWDRPQRLSADLRYSGFGSGNRLDRFTYDFRPTGARTTVVAYRLETQARQIPFISAWTERRYWRNVEARLAARMSGNDG